MSMWALVADPVSPDAMRLVEVLVPMPAPNQLLIATRHASLNHGDLNDARSGRVPPGAVMGSDVSGVVVQAAANGSGPSVGTAVVALATGAFAEFAAVNVGSVATVRDGVDLASAAALPVAGLAALRTLRASGNVLGRRVLVTGASGGVGTFAVQLAAGAGAHAVAVVSAKDRAGRLRGHGASEVVQSVDEVTEPVHSVIDSVGGPAMVRAWELLAPGGVLHSVGATSGEPAVFAPYATVGPAKSLTSYLTFGDIAVDLADLVTLLTHRIVTVQVGWRGRMSEFRDAVQALRSRQLNGKAIFDTTRS